MGKTDWSPIGLAWCGLWHKLVPFSRIDAAAKKLRSGKAAAPALQLSPSGIGRTRITALIDGSRPTADVPALPPWACAAWFDALAKRPARALSLLEGRFTFDDAVATSHEAGVGIFEPESFQGACDCYCSASWRTGICAHEAALLAAAGWEVERDLSFYFKLRGVDARAELEARGIRPAPEQPLPNAAEVIAAAAAEAGEPQLMTKASALEALQALPLHALPRRPASPSAKLPEAVAPFGKRFSALIAQVEKGAEALFLDPRAAGALDGRLAAGEDGAADAKSRARKRKPADGAPHEDGGLTTDEGREALLKALRAEGAAGARRQAEAAASAGWPHFLAALGLSPALAREAHLELRAAPNLADADLAAELVWQPRPRGTRFDLSEAMRPLSPSDFFGALAQLSDADLEALPLGCVLWRQVLRTALALFRARAVAPIPCVPAGVDSPAPRILWTPLPDPSLGRLFSDFAAAMRPLLCELFTPASAPALAALGFHNPDDALPKPEDEGPWGAAAALALTLAASGIAHWILRRTPGENLLEAALAGEDLRSADGLVGAEAQHALSKGFRSLLLSLQRTWRPAVIVKRGAERRISVHFALIAGSAAKRQEADEGEAALEKEADQPAQAAASAAGGLPALSAEEAALAREAELAQGPVYLERALSDPAWTPEIPSVLAALFDAARLLPFLQPLADHPERPMTLEPAQLRAFLLDTAPAFAALGIPLALPAKLRRFAKPRLVARMRAGEAAGASESASLLTTAALSSFDWQVAVGDRTLSLDELRALARQNPQGGIVPVDDDFVLLDPEELRALNRTAAKPPSAIDKVRAMLSGEYLGVQVDVAAELDRRIDELMKVDDVPPPAGLCGTLRPYQARGYAWLVKNMRLGLGSLIADDMGLGKTIQVIAAILEMKAEGLLEGQTVLIVAPTGVLTNWERELRRFAPSLAVGVYHGEGRTVDYIGVPDIAPALRRWQEADAALADSSPQAGEAPLAAGARLRASKRLRLAPARRAPAKPLPDVIVTSYAMLRRELDELMRLPLGLLVLDEAQAVKNPATSQAEAARLLAAPRVIAMTGTPVENRLMEYWSIFSIVLPGLLGTAADFRASFAKPIEANRDAEALARFRRLTSPFMIRRVKTDKHVIADLPEKNAIDRFTSITKPQAALYAEVLKEHLGVIASLDVERTAASRLGRSAGAAVEARRRGQVLALITKLKQICDSPSLYYGTRTPTPDAGKAEALLEILAECREAGRKALIFTQYVEMGERLQDWIEHATGERPDFLCGSVSRTARTAMVDRFQESPDSTVLLVSLRAGGTGLNLTAASCVIHYDLWWNPAVEEQATDRAYRIGQRRDVLVFRFVTAGTFEERVNDMLEQKRELSNLTVQAGESWIGNLPAEELAKLFALSADPNTQAEAVEDERESEAADEGLSGAAERAEPHPDEADEGGTRRDAS